MRSFAALTRAQWFGFIRERQTLFWTIAFPLVFLLFFGALLRDVGAPRNDLVLIGQVAFVEQMPPEAKAQFDALFTTERTTDEQAALQQVKDGKKAGALKMSGTTLVLYYSQADRVKAATVAGTMQSFVSGASLAATGSPPLFTLDARTVEDTSLKPIETMAPGLLGWAIAMGAMFGSAMPLVQWRTTKLLRRLRLTPVRNSTLVTSRAFVVLAVAGIQTVLFVGIAVGLFGLRLRGAWWLSIPLIACATIAFMALGLIVGAVSKTPEGASGLANAVVLPMAFLSGSFIPLDVAPKWLTTVSKVMPLRHLNDGMIDVMVRGKGIEAIGIPILVMSIFAVVCTAVAAKLFRWEG